MFYVIRIIFILILILPLVYVIYKGKKLKKRYYVYSIIFFLILLSLIIGSFYPFEKNLLTFSSEESAFSYICKNYSDCERYEHGNAIFYIERDEITDTLYTITRIGNRFSYVNYKAENFEYYSNRYDDIDLYDGTTPPDFINGITHTSETGFDVNVMYNKTENVSFYNVVALRLQNPEERKASINDIHLTFCTETLKKRYPNFNQKTNCFYYFDKAEPLNKISIKAKNTCGVFKKRVIHHIL